MSFAIDTAVFRVLYADLSETPVIQIVIGNGSQEPGILMATDEDGLRVMSTKPPIQIKVVDKDGALMLGELHLPPRAPRTTQPKKGQVLVINGTKAVSIGVKFLLKDGRLVDPYPTSGFEMEKDGVVQVERIRLTDGPQQDWEGWVRSDDLQRTCTGPCGSL